MENRKKLISAEKRDIPVAGETDVLVVGGGPAGISAAVSAARNGVNTLIVEQFNCLGGAATAGLVGPFMRTTGENGGIYREFLGRLAKEGGAEGYAFESETFKYAAQEMAIESGVKILFYTFAEGVIVEDNRLKGVFVANKNGRQALLAKVIIDATGDGDIAYFAGCNYEKGDSNGEMQGSSMMFRLGGIDGSRVPGEDFVREKIRDAREKGELHLPDYVYWMLGCKGSTIRNGQVSVNVDTSTDIDGTETGQLTEATIKSRRLIQECLHFYHKYVPGYENCHLIDTAYLYGIRETRRILGEYYLTYEDVRNGRKFDDGIARASFFIDIHCAEMFRDGAGWKEKYPVPEEGYEIPYRSLVPRETDNLLVAGRCISSDRKANASLRIIPTCMAMGQAAGLAAVFSVKENKKPGEVDGSFLRKTLISQGADI
ncbi:MAG: FAD-dependent oxidoreductase [Candidatus Omnitrophota bacterium]